MSRRLGTGRGWRAAIAIIIVLSVGGIGGCSPATDGGPPSGPTDDTARPSGTGTAASPATTPRATAHVLDPTGAAATLPPDDPVESATLLAVGDVATCDGSDDEAVARLAADTPGAIALLGDIAYPDGSETDFRDCFAPAWAALGDRLRPVPGNHEYRSEGASPYFGYFGDRAAAVGQGWYAYDLGAWRIYALNSNCDEVGGCDEGSPQLAWLQADLAEHPRACSLAYWHHPRFSSGRHGDAPVMRDIWAVLDAAGVDVVLAGHDHTYERFAPLDADGIARPEGIRSFVVGTGGKSHYEFEHPRAGAEARDNRSYGLLRLDLDAAGYAWCFLATDSSTLVDTGEANCL